MKKDFLDKKASKVLCGIAILMMIYHHLFIDGSVWYINKNLSFFDLFNFMNFGKAPTMQLTIAWFCRICVAIFAFVSGYGIYSQYKIRCDGQIEIKSLLKYTLHRFWSFYKKFLICFVFFISIQLIDGTVKIYEVSPFEFVLNIFGIRADFNGTWWYIVVYYYMLLISPLIYLLLEKINIKRIILFIVAIFLLGLIVAIINGNIIVFIKSITTFIQHIEIIYLIIFIEGMFFAKYRILDMIAEKLNVVTSLVLLVIVFVVRTLVIRAPSDSVFDIILVIPFILGMVKVIDSVNWLKNVFAFFGEYSSYIWYSHAYFYAYVFYYLLFYSDFSILIFIQVVVYSLLTSMMFTYIEKKIFKRKAK